MYRAQATGCRHPHAVNALLHNISGAVHGNGSLRRLSWRKDTKVVMQGYLKHQGKQFTETFSNDLDCFRPSSLAQDLAAGMWNTMLCHNRSDLYGRNFTSWVEPVCPGKEGAFYTGPDVTPHAYIKAGQGTPFFQKKYDMTFVIERSKFVETEPLNIYFPSKQRRGAALAFVLFSHRQQFNMPQ
eukprot:gene25485-3543_t